MFQDHQTEVEVALTYLDLLLVEAGVVQIYPGLHRAEVQEYPEAVVVRQAQVEAEDKI